uniref:Uncharacterized protein n=1 Tax=Amphimedon queenslandica TaxID=400682 RepID=A0A1X7VT31_AMPQE
MDEAISNILKKLDPEEQYKPCGHEEDPSKKKRKVEGGGSAKKSGAGSVPTPNAATGTRRKRNLTRKQVHDLLEKYGVCDVDLVCPCLKEGIRKGHIQLSPHDGLDTVVVTDTCLMCENEIIATVHNVLYQGDIGLDYESGVPDSKVRCSNCDNSCGYYVVDMCTGYPKIDTGKSYSHCTFCSAFGCCVGDFRLAHCSTCNRHYFAEGGAVCSNCYPA